MRKHLLISAALVGAGVACVSFGGTGLLGTALVIAGAVLALAGAAIVLWSVC